MRGAAARAFCASESLRALFLTFRLRLAEDVDEEEDVNVESDDALAARACPREKIVSES
jgi:hypothetical protein